MITLSSIHTSDRAGAALQATLTRLNAGTAGANVALYDTVRPANGAAAGGSPLAAFVLPKPAGVIATGILTLGSVPDALISATGVAAWARVTVGAVHEFDCSVTDTAGTGTIKLSTTQLYAGGTVRLSSGTLS